MEENKESPRLEDLKAAEAEIMKALPAPDQQGLRFTCCQATLTLPFCGVKLIMEVRPDKLSFPSQGDQCGARLAVFFPVQDGYSIPTAVTFGNRLKLLGGILDSNWGSNTDDGKWRGKELDVIGDTWIEALRAAETCAVQEVSRLWVAMKKRDVAANVLRISIVASDTFNVEPITVTGLGIGATDDAAVGPIGARLGDFTGALAAGIAGDDVPSPGTVVE